MSGRQSVSDRALRAQRRSAQRDTTTTPPLILIQQQEQQQRQPSKNNNNKRAASKRGQHQDGQLLKKSRTNNVATAAAVASQHQQPTVVTGSTKKYGLRSRARSEGQAAADSSSTGTAPPKHMALDEKTATVTPFAPRRQIDFSESASSSTRSNKVDREVPPGVINVFPTQKTVGNDAICSCPMQLQSRNNRCSCTAAQVFVADYGKENLDYLKQREQREFSSASKRSMTRHTATNSSPSSPALSCNSPSTCSIPSTASSHEDATTQQDSDDLLITTLLAASSPAPSGGVSDAKFLESTIDHLPKQPLVTPRMRAVLVSWLVEVGVEFNISDSAFHLAISILDGVLQRGPTQAEYNDHMHWSQFESGNRTFDDSDAEDDEEERSRDARMNPDLFFLVKKNELQALGCACAWMGSKLEDKSNPRQEDFSFISDYSVSTTTLRQFEFRIFKQLNFSLQRLTPMHFINPFLRASQACPCRKCEYEHPALRELVMYLLCLARLPSELMDQPPSLVAAAALYLARATLGLEASRDEAMCNKYWSRTLEYYTGYSLTDLRRPVLLIYQYQLQAEQLGVAAFDKFKRDSRRKAALITARRVEDLELPGVSRLYEDLDLIETSEL